MLYAIVIHIILCALVYVGMLRLNWFIKRLPYHILGRQAIVAVDKYGLFSALGAFLEKRKHNPFINK